ncbi:MAG: tetratricopeptide repeat protein [Burkholderiaceae bacterium]
MTTPVDAPYTLKRVQDLIGLTPTVVRALVTNRFVTPSRGPRNELRFTFQDLLLMKTAEALRKARVPTRRIVAALESLRASLPADMPLTGLRITSAGTDVAVRDAAGVREATTGQLLLDFEVQVSPDAVVHVADRLPAPVEPAPDWFELGQELEASDAARAEQAYRNALAQQPDHVDALVNLGALLCETQRCEEAVSLFEDAVTQGIANALLHFNRAVALEDLGERDRAIQAYETALELDPSMADAHYNLGLLLEGAGDGQGALRHFSAFRRLSRP